MQTTTNMNSFTIDGTWDQVKGKLRQTYGQLTDSDLTFAEGKLDELLGRLQSKLGLTAAELNAKLNEIKAEFGPEVSGVGEAAASMLAHAKEKVESMATSLSNQASETGKQITKQMRSLHSESEEFVRRQPRQSLLTALAAGFIVGLLIRR